MLPQLGNNTLKVHDRVYTGMKKEILLSYFLKITPKRYQELILAFSSLDNVWQAQFGDFQKIGWNDNLIHEFLLWRDEVNEDKIAAALEKERIITITKEDPEYPDLLKQIYDPPFCLFVRGIMKKDEFPIAVVGTRKFTAYGKQVTEELVRDLVAQGMTIVSGLALGIDGIAHDATLQTQGRTVAVLGGGNDDRYIQPRFHFQLAQRIISSGGAVITEYPPGTMPTNYTFPKRNRIIAGMSLGTLVIEAAESSGALITSQCALDTNREVFAVPHNITSPTGIGPNNLIKMGAKPVTNANDILEALNLKNVKQFVENTSILPDSPTEAAILPHLSHNPVHIDFIIKASALPSPTVMSAITLMEMKGKVKNTGGMTYALAR